MYVCTEVMLLFLRINVGCMKSSIKIESSKFRVCGCFFSFSGYYFSKAL